MWFFKSIFFKIKENISKSVSVFQIFVSLCNKSTNKKLHLVVKQSLTSNNDSAADMVARAYFNEIHFYTIIWTKLDNFQRSFSSVIPFDKIPQCYAVNCDTDKRILVLENLKYEGFEMFKRDAAFTDTHMKLLLKLYGQFHGISAAFRELKRAAFEKMVADLKDSQETFFKMNSMRIYLQLFMAETDLMLQDEQIKEKFKRYVDHCPEIAMDAIKYDGRNPVILHGDCWSNNIMFKFDVSMLIRELVRVVLRNQKVVSLRWST